MIAFTTADVARRTRGIVDAGSVELPELDARMIWSALAEPGDGVAGALIAAHGARRALEIAVCNAPTARSMTGVSVEELQKGRARWLPRVADAEGPSESARRAGILPLTPSHRNWPRRVDDLGPHAPFCLWVRGDPRALSSANSVALVGARAATAYGTHIAAEFAAELAVDGIGIVSGGAYGIDGAAHRAALASGGVTTAWMAGGVDRPYPAGHHRLLEEIVMSGGALVSDVPCGSAPTKWRFLARNRLIAAASDATVVVEAGWRSGSLNTAGHAAALGRSLGAVPGPVTSPASAGCHRLLREYDAVCVTRSDEVKELIGYGPGADVRPHDPMPHTGTSTRVRDALSRRSERTPEELARRTGMSREAVSAALGLLALEGVVARGESGGWIAV